MVKSDIEIHMLPYLHVYIYVYIYDDIYIYLFLIFLVDSLNLVYVLHLLLYICPIDDMTL